MEHSTRTPPVITEPIQTLCRELDASQEPGYVPVRQSRGSKSLECFVNVRRKVAKDGGRIQFGWTIWEWPGVMIEAERHANWISPRGNEIDITPKPSGISEILFLPTNTWTYDYRRRAKRFHNIRRPVVDDPLVVEFIRISEQIFSLEETRFPGPSINTQAPAFKELEALQKEKRLIQCRLMSQY